MGRGISSVRLWSGTGPCFFFLVFPSHAANTVPEEVQGFGPQHGHPPGAVSSKPGREAPSQRVPEQQALAGHGSATAQPVVSELLAACSLQELQGTGKSFRTPCHSVPRLESSPFNDSSIQIGHVDPPHFQGFRPRVAIHVRCSVCDSAASSRTRVVSDIKSEKLSITEAKRSGPPHSQGCRWRDLALQEASVHPKFDGTARLMSPVPG